MNNQNKKQLAAKQVQATIDPEQAAAKARAERQSKCEARIKAILAEECCSLHVIQVWRDGQPGPMNVEVIANPAQTAPPPPAV